LQIQPFARGDQDGHRGCPSQDVDQEFGALQELLEVIQHQEHLLPTQIVEQLRPEVFATRKRQPERIDDRGDEELK
jgi:hypothetical protein